MSDQPSQERKQPAPIDPRDLRSFDQDTPHELGEHVVTDPNDPFVWLAYRGVSLGDSGNQLMWALFKQSKLSENARPTERNDSLSREILEGLYDEVNEKEISILYEYKASLKAAEALLEVAPPPAKQLQEAPIDGSEDPIRLYDPTPLAVAMADVFSFKQNTPSDIATIDKEGRHSMNAEEAALSDAARRAQGIVRQKADGRRRSET